MARVNITANTELELVVGEGGQMDTAGGDTVLRYEDVQYRQLVFVLLSSVVSVSVTLPIP